jgi:DNA polymerase-3 subunit epsilon
MRHLIIDTETTGLSPIQGHRIIELCILEMIDNKLTGEKLHLQFNPERSISEQAIKIHGLTLSELQYKPKFKDCIQQIIDFIIQPSIWIFHNAHFDMSFLKEEFNKCDLTLMKGKHNIIDTLVLARKKYPKEKNNLNALCDRFNINREQRQYHNALLDCELLYKVYLQLIHNVD